MSYHRGGHAGAVAVSYGTGPVAPLSPSRRYSSGSAASSSSGIGSSTSKFSTYRPASTSILDRPSNYYYSSLSSSNYRSNYLSEYRRSLRSPARSVPSSVYSDAGSGTSLANSVRYSSSTSSSVSSRERSETRDPLGILATSAADIIAKYSPSTYVPNIHSGTQSNLIFGGNAADARSSVRDRGRELPPADQRSSSSSSPVSSANGTYGGRSSRVSRKPPLDTLLASNHALSDATSSTTEVTNNDARNNNDGYASNNNNNINRNHDRQPVNLPANDPAPRPVAVVSPIPVRAKLINTSNNNTELTNNNGHDSRALEDLGREAAAEDDASGLTTVLRARNDPANERTEDRGDAPPPPPPPPPLPPSFLYTLASTSWELTSETANGSPPIVPNNVGPERSSVGNHAGDPTSGPSTSTRTGNISNSASTNDDAPPSSSAAMTRENDYRSVSDQIEGSPTSRSTRNRLQAYRDERCGLNGLRNIGNTCFMNSVIQCLSNTRPLLEYLLNEQYLSDINMTTSGMKGALIKAFSQVIQELWEVGGDHVVNTSSLKSQIQRFAPRFMGYSQQDAQEFLRYLLEGLHEDVNRVTLKPQPIHTDIPDHYTDSQKAAESWKRYLRSEDSTIVDVFVGQLRSSLHCTFCGHVSVTLDPFWDLSLPIPSRSGTVKLNQCLEHFTKEEVLDGDEKPTCSKCQMRRNCTKRFSIQKFPKILVIHLKRFSPMERFRGKLNVLVDFPLTGLDLSAFAAPRVQGCTYNLYGVANHSGTTYSGHYTAYCKHPYSGEWHEYNDSRVSTVPARSVVSSEAYVLFYEQQPHSSHL